MTAGIPTEADVPRRRDSGDSRRRLLDAAGTLFTERGYERTTVREIGARAEVDPALIARYFGSKAALYLETLRLDRSAQQTPRSDFGDAGDVTAFLQRVRSDHPTPTLYAAVRRHQDEELQAAATDALRNRILAPSEERARAAGLDRPELRAEILAAALAGVVLSRTSKALPELGSASAEEIGEFVARMLGTLIPTA